MKFFSAKPLIAPSAIERTRREIAAGMRFWWWFLPIVVGMIVVLAVIWIALVMSIDVDMSGVR